MAKIAHIAGVNIAEGIRGGTLIPVRNGHTHVVNQLVYRGNFGGWRIPVHIRQPGAQSGLAMATFESSRSRGSPSAVLRTVASENVQPNTCDGVCALRA